MYTYVYMYIYIYIIYIHIYIYIYIHIYIITSYLLLTFSNNNRIILIRTHDFIKANTQVGC